MNNIFYVYEHYRPDTGLPFYVGKGKGSRAYRLTRKRGSHHKNICAKLQRLGLEVEVRMVATNLEEEVAFKLERTRIAYWRANGIKLANHSDGGEGPSGYKPTAKQRKQMSVRSRAMWSNPETRAKLVACLQKAMNQPEHLRKQSIASATAWRNPKIRAKRTAALRRSGKRPEFLAKMRIINAAIVNRPDVKAKLSAGVKKHWTDPIKRAKHQASIKRALNRPEVKADLREKALAWFADPKWKAEHDAKAKAARGRPDVVARQTAALRATLAKPDVYAKRVALMRRITSDPKIRAKISAGMKAYWALQRQRSAEIAGVALCPSV